jgi:hypothetical protein
MQSMYNSKSAQEFEIFIKIFLATIMVSMYNRQCWSLTAMMQEVADTHGRFAMACVGKFLLRKCLF